MIFCLDALRVTPDPKCLTCAVEPLGDPPDQVQHLLILLNPFQAGRGGEGSNCQGYYPLLSGLLFHCLQGEKQRVGIKSS